MRVDDVSGNMWQSVSGGEPDILPTELRAGHLPRRAAVQRPQPAPGRGAALLHVSPRLKSVFLVFVTESTQRIPQDVLA